MNRFTSSSIIYIYVYIYNITAVEKKRTDSVASAAKELCGKVVKLLVGKVKLFRAPPPPPLDLCVRLKSIMVAGCVSTHR